MHLLSSIMLGSLGAHAVLDDLPNRDEDMWWVNPIAMLSLPMYIVEKAGTEFLPRNMSRTAKYTVLGLGCVAVLELLLRKR